VLKTTAVLGGLSVIDIASAAAQDDETLLATLAGERRLAVARGDALGPDDSIADDPLPLFRETVVRGPEGLLAFAPERLAEEGRVGLENMLVLTGVRALGGERTTALAGAAVPGDRWFPNDVFQRLGENEWFPDDVFVPEEGVEAGPVVAFRDAEWEPGAPLFAEEWFPTDVFDSAEVLEPGTSGFETADVWPLFAAAGSNFFPDDLFSPDFAMAWEELAAAETATVLSPDDLRG
jgi:hypothetical protein